MQGKLVKGGHAWAQIVLFVLGAALSGIFIAWAYSQGAAIPKTHSQAPTTAKPTGENIIVAWPMLTPSGRNKYKQPRHGAGTSTLFEDLKFLHSAGLTASNESELCSKALILPKVALLFLSDSGSMPLQKVWNTWFRGATGLLPVKHLGEKLCSPSEAGGLMAGWEAVAGVCSTAAAAAADELLNAESLLNPIDAQFLFSVFVHGVDGEARPSGIFANKAAKRQQDAPEGMMGAIQTLLRAALRDPLTTRFVFLSDSDIPLYPAPAVYQELMQDSLSRVAACKPRDDAHYKAQAIGQWNVGLGLAGVDWKVWRKSDLWVALLRKHAVLIAEDVKAVKAFQSSCHTKWDDVQGKNLECSPEQHFIPTLLALHGLEQETDCVGHVSHIEWQNEQPREYMPLEIYPQLVDQLREPELAAAKECTQAWRLFESVGEAFADASVSLLLSQSTCQRWRSLAGKSVRLGPRCPLFARRFRGDATDMLLEAFTQHIVYHPSR